MLAVHLGSKVDQLFVIDNGSGFCVGSRLKLDDTRGETTCGLWIRFSWIEAGSSWQVFRDDWYCAFFQVLWVLFVLVLRVERVDVAAARWSSPSICTEGPVVCF